MYVLKIDKEKYYPKMPIERMVQKWKYRYRANAKNGQEDLDKANWYIKKYAELKEG